MLGVHIKSYITGPAQVVRQVWSVRYQGELLGLWDPQKLVILVENHPHNPDFPVG
jgi:hypothetical protein